jgi:hypothetical protein
MTEIVTYKKLDLAVESDASEVGEGPIFDPRTGRQV